MNRDEHSPESSADERRCRECGAVLASDTRYCPECGTATSDACPSCGEQLHPGERFCRYCGTQVTAFAGGRPGVTRDETPDPSEQQQAGEQPRPSFPSTSSVEPDLRDAGRGGQPSYRPPASGEFTCPRCGELSSVADAFCNSCGLPFDEQNVEHPGSAAEVVYAPLLIRFVARLIDSFILAAILLTVVMATGFDSFFVVDDELSTEDITFYMATTTFYVVTITLQLIYHAGFISLWQMTPGKRVMGLRVEPVTGMSLGFGRPTVRELVIQAPSFLAFTPAEASGAFVSLAFVVVSVLIAFSRTDRRTIHDLAAGTAVIRDRP